MVNSSPNPYLAPMEVWSALGQYAQTIQLPDQNLKLFCYTAGKEHAPAMLLLHGLGDEADTWRHLVLPLAEHFRIIAPDLPGFGRSEKPARQYSLAFFQQAMLELLEVLQIPSAIVVGNSLGAMIAQAIALENPKQTSGLVLIDGSQWMPKQSLRFENLLFMIPGVGEWLYNRLRLDPQAAYKSLYPYYADINHLAKSERDFLFRRVNERVWDDRQRQAYFSALRLMAWYVMQNNTNIKSRLSGMDVKTLIIWGEEDHLMPVENAHALADHLPNARAVILKKTGHVPQQENPEETLNTILGDERFNRS
jgi:pimeloyl-ACP methyl ester carboxylesterase